MIQMYKFSQWVCIGAFVFMACNTGTSKPDISNVDVKLKYRRFEKDLFAIDTNQMTQSLLILDSAYPHFTADFFTKLMGLNMEDTTRSFQAIKQFIQVYRPMLDSIALIEKDLNAAKDEVHEALRYAKYYFPEYKLPEEFVTYVGPMDVYLNTSIGGQTELITSNALCTGLELRLGENSSFYNSFEGQQLYPQYMTKKFNPDYIVVGAMKCMIDDIFPLKGHQNSFIEILVEQGRRMYLLDLLLPDKKEEIKLGYSPAQLKAAYYNEAFMWNYFVENKLLYETDLMKIKSFISDGPFTNEFGFDSPSYVSLFVGKQMIKKYMEKFPKTTLKELFSMDASKILSGSQYKPH